MRALLSILFAGVAFCGCSSGPSWKRQAFAFSLPGDPPRTETATNNVALARVSISPVFQSRSFTYRLAENSYEQDPYAGFLIPPERALAEVIRAWMRASGAFGRVLEPGSGLQATSVVEVAITELYGDFRTPAQPAGVMGIHFVCYEVREGLSDRILLDKSYAQATPITTKTPGALMSAWDEDLRRIMRLVQAEYTKAGGEGGKTEGAKP
jgi:hypothetical protein